MSGISRITAVEPILYGVLKIVWSDGYEGIADIRPVIATGEMFEFLRLDPARFGSVRLEEYGHSIYWIDDDGDDIDFGSDSLRQRADRQAEMHLLAG